VGRRYGSTKLVNGRSLEGTMAYAVVAFLGSLAVLAAWHGEVPPSLGLLAAAVAAVTGALAELFSKRVDDNFAVPVAVALMVGLVFQGAL
jgi:dolichol kinase